MEALRDVRNLTFLYRAPRLILSPLDIRAMAGTYQRVFGYTKTQCLKLAKATNGYSLAFQILGYVSWEHKDADILSAEILEEYDQKLAELAYGKLWTELSETDRRVMLAIAKSASTFPDSVNSWKPRCSRPSSSHDHTSFTASGRVLYTMARVRRLFSRYPCCSKFPSTCFRRYVELLMPRYSAISATFRGR